MRSSRSFASMVIIDGGPGVTDNINPPNVVSVGNPSGVLTLTLPSLVDRFGFGFAVSNANPVPNATAVSAGHAGRCAVLQRRPRSLFHRRLCRASRTQEARDRAASSVEPHEARSPSDVSHGARRKPNDRLQCHGAVEGSHPQAEGGWFQRKAQWEGQPPAVRASRERHAGVD